MDALLERNKNAFIALTLFLVCMGGYQLLNLPISLYPTVSKPVIKVQMTYKEDLAKFMSYWGEKVETSLKNVKDVELVEGEYRQGEATYLVHFGWNKDNDEAIRDVASVADFFQAQLPRDLPPFRTTFFNPGSESYVVVSSEKMDSTTLSKTLQTGLLPLLYEIEGVTLAWVSALGDEQITVNFDPLKAATYNITIQDVIKTIQLHEFDYSLGRINTQSNGKISVTVRKRNENIEQLSLLTIANIADRQVLLRDIAEVKMTETKLSRVLQLDGENAVAVAVWPKPDANLYQVSQNFLTEVKKYTGNLGSVFVLNDPSAFIADSINTVIYAIILGMSTAAIFVLIFFRSFSKTLLVCLAMPLSLFGAGIFMQITGVGINLLSLGAMSVSIGMVIDGAIVIIDNITQHQKRPGQKGNLVFKATMEVAPAIFASVLTTVIVFIPMAYTLPIASSLLRDIIYVIVSIMAFSIFITLVFIPSAYTFIGGNKLMVVAADAKAKFSIIEFIIEGSAKIYCFLLAILVNSRLIQLGFVAAIGALVWYSISTFPEIRRELIAKPYAKIIDVTVSFKKDGLEMPERIAIVEPLRNQANDAFPEEVKFAYSDIRANVGYISLHLHTHLDFDTVYYGLQKILKNSEEYDIEISPWITSALSVPDYPDLRLLVTGDTEQQRRQQLGQIYDTLQGQDEIRKIKITPKRQRNAKYEVKFKQNFINQLFQDHDVVQIKRQLSDYVGLAIEEKYISTIEFDGKTNKLFGQLGEQTLQDVRKIGDLPFFFNGQFFHLRDLLDIEKIEQWKLYYSRNGRPIYMAEVWLKDQHQNAAPKLLAMLDGIQGNDNMVPFILDSPKEQVNKGISSLLKALLLAFGLVFISVFFLFARLKIAVIICSAVPFGIIGALIALYLFDSTLSLNSMLGMIVLCGVSVNNSIIFVDVYMRILAQGKTTVESILDAARARFRAIIVTNMTTLAGMAPLAFGVGGGGEILQPLGISVSFGLLISMAFTMFCVPWLLSMFVRQQAINN